MRTVFRLLLGLVALLATLLVVAVLWLHLVFDPNDYKDQAAAFVKTHTGRELVLRGDLDLKLFPWLGVEAQDVELGNPPGVTADAPFLQAGRLGVALRFWPLLRGRTEFGVVHASGVRVGLIRDAAGGNNWTFGAPADANEPEKVAPDGIPEAVRQLHLEGLELTGSSLRYRDQASGADHRLDDITLKTGVISPADPIQLSLGFTYRGDSIRGLPVLLDVTLAHDWAKDTLRLDAARLSLAEMPVVLQGEVRALRTDPAFGGRIEIMPFEAMPLMKRLGVPYRPARPEVLGKPALKARLAADKQHMIMEDIILTLGSSGVAGRFEVQDYDRKALRFDLEIDRLDVDAWLPAGEASQASSGAVAAGQAQAPHDDSNASLRALDLSGALKLKRLAVMGIQMEDIALKLAAKDGLVQVTPFKARFYKGAITGKIGVDARGKGKPRVTVEQSLLGIAIQPLLKDLTLPDRFTGRTNVAANLQMAGLSAQDIRASLGGTLRVSVDEGALLGVDLQKLRNEIERGRREKDIGALARLSPVEGDRTTFSELRAGFQLSEGKARNDDLTIQSGSLRVTGKGVVDIVTGRLDYDLMVHRYPVRVGGPFSDIGFEPQWEKMLKERVQEKLQEKLGDETREKLKEGLDKWLRKRE